MIPKLSILTSAAFFIVWVVIFYALFYIGFRYPQAWWDMPSMLLGIGLLIGIIPLAMFIVDVIYTVGKKRAQSNYER